MDPGAIKNFTALNKSHPVILNISPIINKVFFHQGCGLAEGRIKPFLQRPGLLHHRDRGQYKRGQ